MSAFLRPKNGVSTVSTSALYPAFSALFTKLLVTSLKTLKKNIIWRSILYHFILIVIGCLTDPIKKGESNEILRITLIQVMVTFEF